ncbi:PREDICTED: AT-rich interactive domain-containing protein 1 [Lupinus angustifolius]|uniref:AT-rich interactive domain-containing protein 1 n=1 Tax=Lupinus angustifolius TaxID=3871 RepID=UPI00092FAE43|nr:PREDICTED: AT-rich interactive domain-containing protein 1 [Lupinus angustifolius]XP_019432988.1 PREDICTED: AT-rich interactive domain-containing protein 1 [Lupinus angustifolius]
MAGDSNDVIVESVGGVVQASYYNIRCRFEELLCRLWGEICVRSRSLPPMLGDGSNVDLYKLFMVVKGKGGYDVVCESKLWDLVAKESGLGSSVGSSVKLVYRKYLGALDAWLKKVADSKVAECGLVDDRDKFGKQLMELQAEVKGLLLFDYADNKCVGKLKGEFDGEGKDGRNLCVKKRVQNGGNCDVEMMDGVVNEHSDGMTVTGEVDGGKLYAKLGFGVHVSDGENSTVGLVCGGKSDVEDGGNGVSSGHKRKRESMPGLLSWVTSIAKNPGHPAVGSLPDKSKWKSNSNQESWKQVLSFRGAVFYKRRFDSSIEQQNWLNQRMHPFMYDDHSGGSYNLRERLRHDKRLLLAKAKATAQNSSGSSRGSRDFDRTPSPQTRDHAEKQLVDSGIDGCPEVRTIVGPSHQAEVPEWTCITSESDSKWLGTQIWPSQKGNLRLLIERDPIGKGRQHTCGCSVPGSVECVRFHIAEKRGKVKLELGGAFYLWNFDKIGEEVKHLWTKEEEKRFKDVVGPDPLPEGYYFWDHIFRAFPKKSRADLVSYYFNVFLLQRRAYQNRHTPEDVDSDDDEAEDGLRNVFGHQTQKSRCSILTPKKSATKRKK